MLHTSKRSLNGPRVSQVPQERAENSLSSQVYERIKADIYEFRLLPGDRFSENEIAAQMGVSRTPVREALFWLQREGYVDVLFRSGWQVKPFDFKYFEDLYDLRIILESVAIERLSDPARAPLLAELNELWSVPAARQSTDPATVAAMDEQFHASLVSSCGNLEMARFHREITERIRIIRRLDFTQAPRIDATYREHAAVLKAIRGKKTEMAQSLITAHIKESQAEVKRITLHMLQAARERYA